MSEPLLVLPTLNEMENLPRLVARIRELEVPVSILVVDDCSPDGTGAWAEQMAKEDPRLSVLHRRGRRGYGAALTAGLQEALRRGAEVVLTMDVDFSHDPADLPRLLSALGEADVAIGSRYTEGGRIADWPPYRRVLSAAANAFVRALFRLPARDCTSGFRGYRRPALLGVPWDRLHSTGYSFLVELLFWSLSAAHAGRRPLREVPICFVDRRQGKSKMGLREVVRGALNLLKLRVQLRRRPGR